MLPLTQSMRRSLLALLMLIPAMAAMATEYTFPAELEEIISSYGETRKAVLPDPRKVRDEQDRHSVAPGRMHLPVNIVVDKPRTRLNVVNVFGDTLYTCGVCASMNRGQKHASDDCRTPEGNFGLVGVYNSTDWRYKGTGAKCYGPFFIHVYTPGFYGIGIHGTDAPYSVPGRRSHGCMRLHNEDIVKVRRMVTKDSRIIILPDPVKPEAAPPISPLKGGAAYEAVAGREGAAPLPVAGREGAAPLPVAGREGAAPIQHNTDSLSH